jgi:hypothetical protein
MTSLTPSLLLVSLVQTATRLPIVFATLPCQGSCQGSPKAG